MSKWWIAPAAAGVAAAALWGWGWLGGRLLRMGARPVTLTIGVGVAAVLFVGGCLNVCGFARPGVLDGLVVFGCLIAGIGLWRSRRQAPPEGLARRLAAALPLVAAGWFLTAYLLPQAAYNVHDDLEKYFAHPIAMLARGAIPPNPLGCMGAETLGGQALLDAFLVAHFPLAYVGAVDGFFFRLLCVAMAGFAVRPGPWGAAAVVAELCVLTVNPQLVNISSLFSGTALIMVAVLVTAGPVEPEARPTRSALLGLVYAGLAALKSTLVVFVGIHFCMVIAVGWATGCRRLRWGLGVAGWTAIFLAPWIWLHAPLYLARRITPVHLLPAGERLPLALFSPARIGYGASQLHYTCLAAAGIVATVGLVLAIRRGWVRASAPWRATAAAAATAAAVYIVWVALLGPAIVDKYGGTRYACPVLIGTLAVGLRLFESADSRRGGRWPSLGVVVAGLAVVAAFVPSTLERAQQLVRYQVPLAFFSKGAPQARRSYIDYTARVLNGPVQQRLARIQSLVPPHEKIVAWVMTPFWLDYRRNRILNTSPAGLAMRWARVPDDAHYFLLEYRGYAVRPETEYIEKLSAPGRTSRLVATRTLDFLRDTEDRATRAQILYNDGSYILMRTGGT